MNEGRDSRGARPNQGLSGSEFAGIGLQFALTMFVFAFAGNWLDKRLGTSPWLVVAGVVIGSVGGFYSMYQKAVRASRRDSPTTGGSKRDSERRS